MRTQLREMLFWLLIHKCTQPYVVGHCLRTQDFILLADLPGGLSLQLTSHNACGCCTLVASFCGLCDCSSKLLHGHHAESLLKPASFRRDRPPPPSPFAEEEPQSSDGTANNSASLGPDYSSMRDKQVGVKQSTHGRGCVSCSSKTMYCFIIRSFSTWSCAREDKYDLMLCLPLGFSLSRVRL